MLSIAPSDIEIIKSVNYLLQDVNSAAPSLVSYTNPSNKNRLNMISKILGASDYDSLLTQAKQNAGEKSQLFSVLTNTRLKDGSYSNPDLESLTKQIELSMISEIANTLEASENDLVFDSVQMAFDQCVLSGAGCFDQNDLYVAKNRDLGPEFEPTPLGGHLNKLCDEMKNLIEADCLDEVMDCGQHLLARYENHHELAALVYGIEVQSIRLSVHTDLKKASNYHGRLGYLFDRVASILAHGFQLLDDATIGYALSDINFDSKNNQAYQAVLYLQCEIYQAMRECGYLFTSEHRNQYKAVLDLLHTNAAKAQEESETRLLEIVAA